MPSDYPPGMFSTPLFEIPIPIPDNLVDSRWEDHAILGPEAAIAIVSVYRRIVIFNNDFTLYKSCLDDIADKISNAIKAHQFDQSSPEAFVASNNAAQTIVANYIVTQRFTTDGLRYREKVVGDSAQRVKDSITTALDLLKEYDTSSPSA